MTSFMKNATPHLRGVLVNLLALVVLFAFLSAPAMAEEASESPSPFEEQPSTASPDENEQAADAGEPAEQAREREPAVEGDPDADEREETVDEPPPEGSESSESSADDGASDSSAHVVGDASARSADGEDAAGERSSESESNLQGSIAGEDEAVDSGLVHNARLAPHEAPRPWHIRLSSALSESLLRDESYDAASRDDQLVTAGASVEGEWVFLSTIAVAVQVGYLGGAFGSSLFDSLKTDGQIHALQVGASLGYRLWDAVMPYVRGGFIATWSTMKVEGLDEDIDTEAFAPGWYAMGGVELTLARRWIRRIFRTEVFTIGLRFEAGYADFGQHEFDESRELEGVAEERQASLGTLSLGGAAMNFGFILSF